MTLTIAGMVLASALLHPVWNLLIKKSPDPNFALVWFTLAMVMCALTHTLLSGADLIPPQSAWPLMALSVSGQVIYGICLTATLKRGDLSTYYPIIRASPVAIVLLGVLFLGRSYEFLTLAGMAMAVLGGFLLFYRRNTRVFEDPLTLGLALLALLGTGIYSLADEQIAQVVAPSVQMFWIEGILLPIFWLRYYSARSGPVSAVDPSSMLQRLPSLLLPGLIGYASYILILMAYKMGGEVAAVTSIRQASIPLSVLLGGYFFNEGSIIRRLIASVVLTLGIVLVVVSA